MVAGAGVADAEVAGAAAVVAAAAVAAAVAVAAAAGVAVAASVRRQRFGELQRRAGAAPVPTISSRARIGGHASAFAFVEASADMGALLTLRSD